MKQSYRTALDIYKEILRLNAELNEVGEACSAVRQELGEDHIGYTLLKKSYDEKLAEVRAAEHVKFTQVDTGITSLPPGVGIR